MTTAREQRKLNKLFPRLGHEVFTFRPNGNFVPGKLVCLFTDLESGTPMARVAFGEPEMEMNVDYLLDHVRTVL